MPVTFSKSSSKSSWNAYIDPEEWNPLKPSIYIYSPASASVGSYRFQLCVLTQDGQKSSAYGNFILLCNPWCSGKWSKLSVLENQIYFGSLLQQPYMYQNTYMVCVA